MASQSRRWFVGHGKNGNRALCLAILASMVLLDRGLLALSSIFPQEERHTASEGDLVKIYFEFCGNDKPSCSVEHIFNLSAPNPACTGGRYSHCDIGAAPPNHRKYKTLHPTCDFCELTVHDVTQKDAGKYTICETSTGCTPVSWWDLTSLVIETPTSSPSTEPISPTTTTTPTPGESKITKTTTEDSPEINSVPVTNKAENKAHTGMKLSSAVGIPVTLIVLVIVFICGAVYLYKRRSREQRYHPPTESPLTNGNMTTVNINLNNADRCSVEIDGEKAQDPDLNT